MLRIRRMPGHTADPDHHRRTPLAPVEEDFQIGKGAFALDHSQVRTNPALLRHLVLAIAALAVVAVTAAHARTTSTAPTISRPR